MILYLCSHELGPSWPGALGSSPHQEDRRDAGQRGDADGARRRAVVARNLGHDVNLERALVILVADERRDDDLPRLAIYRIAIGRAPRLSRGADGDEAQLRDVGSPRDAPD